MKQNKRSIIHVSVDEDLEAKIDYIVEAEGHDNKATLMRYLARKEYNRLKSQKLGIDQLGTEEDLILLVNKLMGGKKAYQIPKRVQDASRKAIERQS
ncbi:hypothetical protein KC669_01880 [Candidatus Dojkabacteria bacterium]|uniref:Ribbon-helix-helix protein, CopG family n=1 Tax=Candidatus Dojkabacteria bacterium TaxID=2099670 RepID=A0A955LAD5_9BACT|nr:hypothetical protein [Candidatus Dojkabacteria bacterium]